MPPVVSLGQLSRDSLTATAPQHTLGVCTSEQGHDHHRTSDHPADNGDEDEHDQAGDEHRQREQQALAADLGLGYWSAA